MTDLLTVSVITALLFFYTANSSPCNPYLDGPISHQYVYDSSVSAFTESIAKSIYFVANFTLQCDNFDKKRGLFDYSIILHRIATKMHSTDKRKKASVPIRRRKIPAPFKMSATMDPLTNKIRVTHYQTRHRRAADQENVWYDLVSDGFQFHFSRLQNGTVTQIRIPNSSNSSEITVGILKTLALIFNINRNMSTSILLENDDLGQHYSKFTFSRTHNYDSRFLRTEKSVEPDDFNSHQFDSVNSGRIAVKQKQIQFINYDTLEMLNSTGRISTTSSPTFENFTFSNNTASDFNSNPEKLITSNALFQVDVAYSLKLARILPFAFNVTKGASSNDAIFDFTNFAPQKFDDSNELQKILTIKEELLKTGGSWHDVVRFVVDEVRSGKDKEANLLRGALLLESTLYLRGKRQNKPILDAIFPSATKVLVESLEKANFDVAFRILYVLSGAQGDEVNKIFLGCFALRSISEIETNRRIFLNTISQMQFPSDELLSRVVEEFEKISLKTVFRSQKEANATRRHYHAMICAGNLLSRQTVSPLMRREIIDWFKRKISTTFSGADRCRGLADAKFLYEPIFDAIANFMTPELAASTPNLANSSLVAKILEIAQGCYAEKQPEFALTALQTLRRLYQLAPISDAIAKMVTITAASCQHRSDILAELVNRMDYDEKMRAPRIWPRYGVIVLLDSYVTEQFLAILDRNYSSFDCDRMTLLGYLKMKRGRAWDELFEQITERHYRSYNNSGTITFFHQRYRRQLPGLGGLLGGSGTTGTGSTGTGSTGTGGGQGGQGLAPSTVVECNSWDSQVGANYKSIYDRPSLFDYDSGMYGSEKRHCIFDLSFKFQSYLTLGIQAGFFSGKNTTSRMGRLFGKAWAGLVLLGSPQEFAVVQFSRYQRPDGFRGDVKLTAFGSTYLDEKQDHCNMSYKLSLRPLQWTLPAFRVQFAGFTFLMTADFALTFNLTLNPSYCAPDGEMGARFLPGLVAEATAYAELENDFFGMGMQASVNVNYFFDFQGSMPSGCMYIHHGNDDMYLKFDFYIKLPSFVFLNANIKPVTIRQPWPIFTWQLVIKKSGRYVLFGFCMPLNLIYPEAIPYYNT